MCGHGELKEVTEAAKARVPETRNALRKRGVEISQNVKDGDIIAVEVDDVNEPWMLGRVVIKDRREGPRTAAEHKPESENWMGKIERGDPVIDVVKLEPICPGSRSFQYPDKTRLKKEAYDQKHFAVFVEDVRLVGIELVHKPKYKPDSRPRRLSGIEDEFVGQYDYWELQTEDREEILQYMPKYDGK